MPLAKVPADRAKDHGGSAGHIFAAVVADSFADGDRAAVAHAEPFARAPRQIQFAARRAKEGYVSGQQVILFRPARVFRRFNDDARAA